MGEMVDIEAISAYLAPGDECGIVVLHEWWGLVPHVRDLCDRFAALGFTAIAPDLYRGATAANSEPDEAEKLLMQMDRTRAVADVAITVDELRRRGCRKVGVIGFCMGGALALTASATCSVDATVAYYGIWPQTGERDITHPVLIHVAEHEEHNPPALPANFPTWFQGMDNVDIHIYPGTQHAFFNDTRPEAYDPVAASLSWDRTVSFLATNLG